MVEDFGNVDVLVIGGGNAALCAAIEALENGASVLVLECSPKSLRGGNSRHTRNMRLAHEKQIDPYTGAYPADEMWNDYMRCTGGMQDPELAKMTVYGSPEVLDWARARGVRFQPALAGTLHLSRTNAWFLGGGKSLMNTLYRYAEKLGARVLYDAEAIGLDIKDGRFHSRNRPPERAKHSPDPRQGSGRGGRRVAVEPRLPQERLGSGGRQLPGPRHSVRHRHDGKGAVGCRRRVDW